MLLEAFPFSTKRGIEGKAYQLGLHKRRLLPPPKKSHNTHLFESWTERSAYLLGYLEADGSVEYGPSSVRVQFACSAKDSDYLHILRAATESTADIGTAYHKLSSGQEYTSKRFTVTSRQWAPFLYSHLRIGHIPEDIPGEVLRHYIRGYFDGDGSFYWESRSHQLRASIVGTPESMVESIAEALRPITESMLTVYRKTNSNMCWYISMSCKAARRLRDWMYPCTSLYLTRKMLTSFRVQTHRGG